MAVLKALGAAEGRTTIISHEFMGMPTVLAAKLEPYCNFRTVFYAHEVATVRRIVEEHPGHDTMFYNVMRQAHHWSALIFIGGYSFSRFLIELLRGDSDRGLYKVPGIGLTMARSSGFSGRPARFTSVLTLRVAMVWKKLMPFSAP